MPQSGPASAHRPRRGRPAGRVATSCPARPVPPVRTSAVPRSQCPAPQCPAPAHPSTHAPNLRARLPCRGLGWVVLQYNPALPFCSPVAIHLSVLRYKLQPSLLMSQYTSQCIATPFQPTCCFYCNTPRRVAIQ